MKQIIALAGTQGTGKTTVAYEVCTELKKAGVSAVVMDERARECPFPINEIATNETQVWLIVSHIKKELELMKAYDIVVSDRSVIDPYIYGKVVNIKNAIYSYLLNYCIEHIKKYYAKLYLLNPRAFDYCIADGVRSTNDSFRNAVHNKFIDTFSEYGIDFAFRDDTQTILKEVLDYVQQ